MSPPRPPRRLTATEYLMLEAVAPTRSEFVHGERFAVPVLSTPHLDIRDNLVRELGNRLHGSGCHPLSAGQRVRVPTGLFVYPDIVVVRGRPESDPLDAHTLTNPAALVETLSPDTAEWVRDLKLGQYQHVNGLAEVLLVSATGVWAEVYSRRPDGRWADPVVSDSAGDLVLPGLNVRIPLPAVYGDALPQEPVRRGPTRLDPPTDSAV